MIWLSLVTGRRGSPRACATATGDLSGIYEYKSTTKSWIDFPGVFGNLVSFSNVLLRDRGCGSLRVPPHETALVVARVQKSMVCIAAKKNGLLPLPMAQGRTSLLNGV
jgi:hypothetical protein